MTACQGEPLPLPLLLGKTNFLLETDPGGQRIARLQQVTACYPELLIFTAFKYHLNIFELVIEKTHLVKDSKCLRNDTVRRTGPFSLRPTQLKFFSDRTSLTGFLRLFLEKDFVCVML